MVSGNDGRKIRLPGPDRTWYDDPQRGRKSLLPLSSLSTTSPASPRSVFLRLRDGRTESGSSSPRWHDDVYGLSKGFRICGR